MHSKLKAAGALAALLLAASYLMGTAAVGNPGANRGQYTYFDWRKRAAADSIDSARNFFAKAGSLTTNPDSSAGYATHFKMVNMQTGQVNVRVYCPGGTYDPGTDSAYAVVMLQSAGNATSDVNEWVAPPGLRVDGFRIVTSTGGAVFIWEAGR